MRSVSERHRSASWPGTGEAQKPAIRPVHFTSQPARTVSLSSYGTLPRGRSGTLQPSAHYGLPPAGGTHAAVHQPMEWHPTVSPASRGVVKSNVGCHGLPDGRIVKRRADRYALLDSAMGTDIRSRKLHLALLWL